jgi:hypothetical protein
LAFGIDKGRVLLGDVEMGCGKWGVVESGAECWDLDRERLGRNVNVIYIGCKCG